MSFIKEIPLLILDTFLGATVAQHVGFLQPSLDEPVSQNDLEWCIIIFKLLNLGGHVYGVLHLICD